MSPSGKSDGAAHGSDGEVDVRSARLESYSGSADLGPSPESFGVPNITGGPTTRGAAHTKLPRLVRSVALLIVAATAATVVAGVLS
jgi:hypothetical protein